jgi:hypothetical protein
VIHLHPAAPPKPALDAPCNGCGACCAWQPCPLGVILSRRRHGACVALQWLGPPQSAATRVDGAGETSGRYACGALLEPGRWLWLLRPLPSAWSRRLLSRWIAAGKGCDADFEAQTLP